MGPTEAELKKAIIAVRQSLISYDVDSANDCKILLEKIMDDHPLWKNIKEDLVRKKT